MLTIHNTDVSTAFDLLLVQSLKTDLGVEVRWSGTTKVEVLVNQESKSHLCGLCGNYNNDPSDDWIVGPECPEQGQVVSTGNVICTPYLCLLYLPYPSRLM